MGVLVCCVVKLLVACLFVFVWLLVGVRVCECGAVIIRLIVWLLLCACLFVRFCVWLPRCCCCVGVVL